MKSRSIVVFLLCLAGGVVEATARCRDLRDFDFSNTAYEIRSDKLLAAKPIRFRANLRDGKYQVPHRADSLAFFYAQSRSVRFGDLTNDGNDEAVVAIEYGSNSASFFLTNYFVFGCRGGQIRLIASIEQDRLEKQSEEILHESMPEPIYISGGVLHIRHGAGGSRPSPIYTVTFRYNLSRGILRPTGPPEYLNNSFGRNVDDLLL